MIRLPLDQHHGSNIHGPQVIVDLVEEGYAVDLMIELEPGEVGPSLPGAVLDGDDQVGVIGVADEDELARSQRRVRQLTDQLEKSAKEIEELRRRILDARDQPMVSRTLLPDEARALGSMLVHFAREAERRR